MAAAGWLPGSSLQLQLSVLFAVLRILRAGYPGLSSQGVSETRKQTASGEAGKAGSTGRALLGQGEAWDVGKQAPAESRGPAPAVTEHCQPTEEPLTKFENT